MLRHKTSCPGEFDCEAKPIPAMIYQTKIPRRQILFGVRPVLELQLVTPMTSYRNCIFCCNMQPLCWYPPGLGPLHRAPLQEVDLEFRRHPEGPEGHRPVPGKRYAFGCGKARKGEAVGVGSNSTMHTHVRNSCFRSSSRILKGLFAAQDAWDPR